MTRKRREWIYEGDEFDRECILKFEYILGRKLKDFKEYENLDSYLDGMVIEYAGRKDFFADYPDMRKYKTEFCLEEKKRKVNVDIFNPPTVLKAGMCKTIIIKAESLNGKHNR